MTKEKYGIKIKPQMGERTNMALRLNVKYIEKRRIKYGVSKTDFAIRIGYSSPSGYSNLIRDGYVPRDRILNGIAKVLKCRTTSLIKFKV